MTELIWDGKYDPSTGKKCAPPRITLPFQTVETVNESAADRHRNLSLFSGAQTEWRNRLTWGDKKYVLPSLLPEFAGKVKLIYIDPPFDTGANFSYLATIPDAPNEAQRSPTKPQEIKTRGSQSGADDLDLEAGESAPGQGTSGLSFVKEPSVIEQKAYRDTWGKGLDSYLKWFYDTVVLLRELLADDGSLYVHLDWHVSHYAKAILDEVYGLDNFKNEISWKRTTTKSDSTQGATNWPRIHDVIFYYQKDGNKRGNFGQPFIAHSEEYIEAFYDNVDANGRKYTLDKLTAPGSGTRGHPQYELMGVTRYWVYGKDKMEQLVAQGRIVQTSPGTVPRYKRYLDEVAGVAIGDIWIDIPPVASQALERTGYATQKPEALLERIIKASSNPGDLVLDCFCGSGTTAAVAEKLHRRWITCDLGRFAIHTTRKRLLAIENVKPFTVQNLGKYERQAWQTAEFGDKAAEVSHNYRHFILSLYRAQPLNGYVWLHGVKNGRMVHVGDVAAPISVDDVRHTVAEFHRLQGTGKDAPAQAVIDILGWDFAFEVNEVAKQQAALSGVEIRPVRIPREVLEKKAVEQGDIKFFELAALAVTHEVKGRSVRLELTDFVIPLDDVPQDVQKAITHWEQWIDYWAVDWDNKGDTFHNQWQDYRTRQKKTLQKVIHSPPGTYTMPGEYKIVVKVIDILGNDTTKTLFLTIG